MSSEVAGELTYRSALENYINSFSEDIKARNEASVDRRNGSRSRNKPDFLIEKGRTPIGYIETKDIGIPLDDLISPDPTSQFQRYSKAYPNLIITDYLEFRRYVRGELRSKTQIGKKDRAKGIVFFPDGSVELTKFFEEFLLEEATSVSSPSELASRLAHLTRQVKRIVVKELKVEEDSVRLHKLMAAFKKVLLADMNLEKFADMFAQTLAYGFFAARVHYDGRGEFSRRTASSILPKTNPFLRKIFSEFANESLPDSLVSAVDDIVDLLKKTDVVAVLKHFGDQGKQDPVVHFYESFLGAYDPSLKKAMGVFYTPDPVVDYMVRSIDELLVSRLGRRKGLLDDKTMILDPALGTGSFLNKILSHISARVQKGAWDSYVTDSLLERVFGFEILMAPYAVAHLNLGIKLQNTGYSFTRDQRLGVFLTNTLEETAKRSEVLFSDWLSEEANAADAIKKTKPILVVTGNPPYSKESQNDGEWIRELMRGFDSINNRKCSNYFECEGKPLNERNPKWLNDDYVKFIRFAHWRVERTGHGIIAFITNHGFLDNPTFRGMREALIRDFDEIYILDLHGNAKKREKAPDGKKDENVFDIQQGVSINFFIRSQLAEQIEQRHAKVYRADLFGDRESKFAWLLKNSHETTDFEEVKPESPSYLFIKQNKRLLKEYNTGLKITDVFQIKGVGITSARDSFIMDFQDEPLLKRVKLFKTFEGSNESLCTELEIPMKKGWNIERSREMMRREDSLKQHIKPILYRPFDYRRIFYHDALVWRTARKVMEPMVSGNNLGLLYTRPMAPSYEFTALVTTSIIDQCSVGNKSAGAGISYIAPLKIQGKTNLSKLVLDMHSGFGNDEDILAYIYAVFYSREYRTRYSQFLKTDFPRIQFTSDTELFKKLSKYGKELIELHLLRDDRLDGGKSGFGPTGNNVIEKVRFDREKSRVFINKTQFFSHVESDQWEFNFGGYNVLEKWLKDRQGRKLSHLDISEYEKIIEMFKRTATIMDEIDGVIGKAGGWPLQKDYAEKKKRA